MSTASTSLVPSVRRREFLAKAVKKYTETIEIGEAYLADRGITLDIAKRWRLGIVDEPLSGHDEYRDRLAIPYRTPAGPSGIVFRCIRDHDHKEAHCAKYLAEPGERRGLFNVHALHVDTPALVICEGELDALVCTALADLPAVGIPGATKWEPHWGCVFDAFDEVVAVCDGDEAGRKLAKAIRGHLNNARCVVLPAGEDCNSFIVTHGAEAFRRKIEVGHEEVRD